MASKYKEYSLLALFHTGGPPKLLDRVDLRVDRFKGFWTDKPLINLTPTTQAYMIYHHHFNSNQSYNIISLMFVRNQRLELILSVAPFSETSQCVTFTSKVVFRTLMDHAHQYPRVVAAVTLKREPNPRSASRGAPALSAPTEGPGNGTRLSKCTARSRET